MRSNQLNAGCWDAPSNNAVRSNSWVTAGDTLSCHPAGVCWIHAAEAAHSWLPKVGEVEASTATNLPHKIVTPHSVCPSLPHLRRSSFLAVVTRYSTKVLMWPALCCAAAGRWPCEHQPGCAAGEFMRLKAFTPGSDCATVQRLWNLWRARLQLDEYR